MTMADRMRILPLTFARLTVFLSVLGVLLLNTGSPVAAVEVDRMTCDRPNCKGTIECPIKCPKCRLSCRFCGMSYCPKCNRIGSVCQDPRFIGGDGVMFYFHGHKNADFCIMSDATLHVNAHFIGKRPVGRPRDFTWVQALAFLFESHKLYIGAKTVAKWAPDVDQFIIYYDGAAVSLPKGEGKSWVAASKQLLLTRTESVNAVNLEIVGLLNSSVSIVPVTKEDSHVHKYDINSETDCFAHLEVNFDFLRLTSSVDGVLGQTYRPGFASPVKKGVPMPIMGGETKYLTSSIFTPDCNVSQFKAIHYTSIVNADIGTIADPFKARCGSDGSGSSGFVCRR